MNFEFPNFRNYEYLNFEFPILRNYEFANFSISEIRNFENLKIWKFGNSKFLNSEIHNFGNSEIAEIRKFRKLKNLDISEISDFRILSKFIKKTNSELYELHMSRKKWGRVSGAVAEADYTLIPDLNGCGGLSRYSSEHQQVPTMEILQSSRGQLGGDPNR